jgi:hypothetical protein
MAKKFLTGLNLANLASDPEWGIEGDLYFNTTKKAIRIYRNNAWTDLSESIEGDLNNITSISTPDFIEFDTTYVSPSAGLPKGSLYWNNEDQTLDLVLENEVVLNLGQEEHYPPVINNSGVQINRGELVMVTSIQGDKLAIAKAVTDGSVPFDYIIGVAAHDILDGEDEATILKFGYINPVNTNSYAVGTILYPNPAVAGGLTDVQPDAPGYRIPIAIVTNQGTGGRILVRMASPSRLGESDSNVKFSGLENEDILVYNSASSLWVNNNIQNYINTASAAAYASASAYTDAEISSLTTSDIEEGSNLYFTEERALNTASTALVHNNHNNIVTTYDSENNEIILSASVSSGAAIANTSLSEPDASENTGLLYFNPNDFTFNIAYGGTWLQLASVAQPITGGNSSTTEFTNIFDGGDSSSTYDSFLVGGNS